MPKLKDNYLFQIGVARSATRLAIGLRNKKITEEDDEITHAVFGSCYIDNDPSIMKGMMQDWNVQAMCVVKAPSEKVIAISGDGEVLAYFKGGETWIEDIIPKPSHSICNMATIAGYAYACGMNRQAYKRMGDGKWEAMHAPDSSKLKGAYGFEAIAGFSASDIYAVGWKGEIWHYEGKAWQQIDSPTNTKLNMVVCTNNEVYAGGKDGILLRGRDHEWSVINQEGCDDDIWGMQWFSGKLYAATMFHLYVLEEDNLVPIDMGDDEPSTCFQLTSAEGTMWSIGSHDVFAFDGKKWTRIE